MKTTARRGYAVFPSLTIHSDQATVAGARSEGASPVQPWSVAAWLQAIVACDNRLHALDGWTASVVFDVSGVPTLSISSPPRYVETKAAGPHPGMPAWLENYYERETISAIPVAVEGVHTGFWSAWDPSEGAGGLHKTQLRTLAASARKRRYSGPGDRSSTGPVFILGSSDPEMEAIAQVIRDEGHRLIWGTKEGRRLRPGEDAEMVLPEGVEYLGVECAVNGAPATFDHHGVHERAQWPPAQYWKASSLGQVWQHFHGHGVLDPAKDAPPMELLMTAALDHCKAAACMGQCPGVSASDAQHAEKWRARGNFGAGLTDKEFEVAWARAGDSLRDAEPSSLGFDVMDLTHLPIDGPIVKATGEQYPSAFQFGPSVASCAGKGYVVRIRRGDGLTALRVGGCGKGSIPGEDPIHRWLEGAGVDVYGCHPAEVERPNGLYGNAVRGFAGGTLRQQDE